MGKWIALTGILAGLSGFAFGYWLAGATINRYSMTTERGMVTTLDRRTGKVNIITPQDIYDARHKPVLTPEQQADRDLEAWMKAHPKPAP